MTKLWVILKPNNATQVSTENCQNVDDFLEACKEKLQIPNPPQELCLSTTDGGTPLQPDDSIIQITGNTTKNPLFIGIKENHPIPPPLSPRKKTRLEAIKQYNIPLILLLSKEAASLHILKDGLLLLLT